MKICSYCELTKSNKEFGECSKHADKLQSRCKECKKQTRKEHYENNRKKYIDKARLYKAKMVKKVAEIKAALGCKVCGEKEPCCLDFHHHQGDKNANVSHLCRDAAWSKVEVEMKKCIVVCKNCHCKLHNGLIETV